MIEFVIYRLTEAQLSIEFVPIHWSQSTDTFPDRPFVFFWWLSGPDRYKSAIEQFNEPTDISAISLFFSLWFEREKNHHQTTAFFVEIGRKWYAFHMIISLLCIIQTVKNLVISSNNIFKPTICYAFSKCCRKLMISEWKGNRKKWEKNAIHTVKQQHSHCQTIAELTSILLSRIIGFPSCNQFIS